MMAIHAKDVVSFATTKYTFERQVKEFEMENYWDLVSFIENAPTQIHLDQIYLILEGV